MYFKGRILIKILKIFIIDICIIKNILFYYLVKKIYNILVFKLNVIYYIIFFF